MFVGEGEAIDKVVEGSDAGGVAWIETGENGVDFVVFKTLGPIGDAGFFNESHKQEGAQKGRRVSRFVFGLTIGWFEDGFNVIEI